METYDALFEIGCEELPPGYFQSDNYESLKMEMANQLIARSYQVERQDVLVDATPRRIVFRLKNLPSVQPSSWKEFKGPKKEQGYKADGSLTAAGEGFLRKTGAVLDEVKIQDGQMVVNRQVEGRQTRHLLSEIFLAVFKKIQFNKTMRWEESQTRFARPIRWIVAVYGNEVVELEIAGVKSGRITKLHPLHKSREIEVANLADYQTKLMQGSVVLEKREERIRDLLDQKVKELNGHWRSPEGAAELVLKVTQMAEYPGVLVGSIKAEYMNMPPEVLITAMREHQQYFAVQDKSGKLLPYFLAVHDNPFAQGDAMRPGCERVLEARLKDAQFFYQEDMKHSLESLVPQLERVLWIKGLGNLLDKTKRLETLCALLSGRLEAGHQASACQAAHLAKADLITNMVQEKEYTSLQGIMGGIYAAAQGLPREVAQAMGEQYLPRFTGDSLPQSPSGRILALADKLDHILGCWGAGFVPTGAKDPYALRRAAQGVITISLGASYRYLLSEVLQQSARNFTAFQGREEQIAAEVKNFIQARLETELQNRGMAPDLIQAVLGVWWDDITAVVQKAEAIHGIRTQPEFNGSILTFSRVVNILPKETVRQVSPQALDLPVDSRLLSEEAEKNLFAAYQTLGKTITDLSQQGDFEKAFETLGKMKALVDQFFDQVMVMDKDEAIRKNRLNLLENLGRKIWSLADFSKLVIAA